MISIFSCHVHIHMHSWSVKLRLWTMCMAVANWVLLKRKEKEKKKPSSRQYWQRKKLLCAMTKKSPASFNIWYGRESIARRIKTKIQRRLAEQNVILWWGEINQHICKPRWQRNYSHVNRKICVKGKYETHYPIHTFRDE